MPFQGSKLSSTATEDSMLKILIYINIEYQHSCCFEKNLQKLASCRWPCIHGKAPRAQKHRCPLKIRSRHTQQVMVDFSERPSPYQMPTRSPNVIIII
jgi:hypothetical protein